MPQADEQIPHLGTPGSGKMDPDPPVKVARFVLVLTPEVEAKIVAAVRARHTFTAAAVGAGVSRSTLYRWFTFGRQGIEPYARLARAVWQAQALARAEAETYFYNRWCCHQCRRALGFVDVPLKPAPAPVAVPPPAPPRLAPLGGLRDLSDQAFRASIDQHIQEAERRWGAVIRAATQSPHQPSQLTPSLPPRGDGSDGAPRRYRF